MHQGSTQHHSHTTTSNTRKNSGRNSGVTFPTMASYSLFIPSAYDLDIIMDEIWDEESMHYLIYTRMVSKHGNEYIKGLIVLKEGVRRIETYVPPEAEAIPVTSEEAYSFYSDLLEFPGYHEYGISPSPIGPYHRWLTKPIKVKDQ